MGVVGGEALVKEKMGEGGVCFLEGIGEGLSFGGLCARCAIRVERIADENDPDVALADEASNGFEVSAESRAVEGEERLRGKP